MDAQATDQGLGTAAPPFANSHSARLQPVSPGSGTNANVQIPDWRFKIGKFDTHS